MGLWAPAASSLAGWSASFELTTVASHVQLAYNVGYK
jgi:hypothetical protein